MQAWLDIRLDHTTELQQHGTFGLRHDVEAVPGHHGQHHSGDQGDQRFIAHQRLSLVRGGCCCCCRSCAARAAASLADAETLLDGADALRLPSTILSSGR
ncbi:hypothetical protein D3C81_1294900 [compost metagenome]